MLTSGAYLPLHSESSSYLSLYNILNFPVDVMPITTVMLMGEDELAFYNGYNGDCTDNISKRSISFFMSPQGHRPRLIHASIPSGISTVVVVRAGVGLVISSVPISTLCFSTAVSLCP